MLLLTTHDLFICHTLIECVINESTECVKLTGLILMADVALCY